jgi:sugar diacid utilization regulator
MIQVNDLANLEYFRDLDMELLGGEGGLHRPVTTANFVQLFTFDKWMTGGEFLLVNGIGLHLEKKENILTIIKKADKKHVACIIFMKNPYLKAVPKEAVELANQLNFPIFFIPSEPPFSECISVVFDFISHRQSQQRNLNELTRNILSFDLEESVLREKLTMFGYAYAKQHCAVIFSGSAKADAARPDILPEQWNFLLHHLYLQLTASLGKKPLYMIQNQQLTILFTYDGKESLTELIMDGMSFFHGSYPDISFQIGCGTPCSDPSCLKKSYHEAMRCLKIGSVKDTPLFYQELGLLKLCLDQESQDNVIAFIQDTLKPVLDFDASSSVSMLETLDFYIQANFNITHAARLAYLHRNTMIQRVNKLEEIFGKSLDDADFRRELSAAVYFNHYYHVQ